MFSKKYYLLFLVIFGWGQSVAAHAAADKTQGEYYRVYYNFEDLDCYKSLLVLHYIFRHYNQKFVSVIDQLANIIGLEVMESIIKESHGDLDMFNHLITHEIQKCERYLCDRINSN